MQRLISIRLFSIRNKISFLIKLSPKKFVYGFIFILVSTAGVYFAIYEGLNFIISLGGLGPVIIKKLIFILFFLLFFLVSVSFGVLFYGLSFRSKEAQFLLALPIPREKILNFKFIEATILASWIPFLGTFFFFLAYSNMGNVGPSLALVSLLFSVPFFIISCFFGYLTALFIARYFNLKGMFLTAGVILLLIFIFYSNLFISPERKDIFYYLSEEVVFLKFSKIWFLPFSWPGYGIIAFEDCDFRKSILYLTNLWSLAFLCLTFLSSPGKLFISVYHRQFAGQGKKTKSKDSLTLIFSRLNLPPYFSSFIVKDIKLFIREPSLWLQFLIFFGILFFYFLNLRNLSYHLLEPMWRNLLTYLNTFSILCIISAMSVRFIFPQWSLEGRNFWILKLTPISLRKIFLEKFLLAATILSLISLFLISVSNLMLKIPPYFFFLTFFMILLSTITLVSISLGLGGYFVNFKEEYYLKAVESFGGFITLVISFGYIFLTISLFSFLTHLYFIGKLPGFKTIVILAVILWSIMSIFISLITLGVGMKELSQKEY